MLLELGMTSYAMDKHFLYQIRQLIVRYIRGAINHSLNDILECMYFYIKKNLQMFQLKIIKIKVLSSLPPTILPLTHNFDQIK